MWYRIELPYAVFGIQVMDGRVVDAADIGKWMIGKQLTFVQAWVQRKKGEIQCLSL